MYPLWIRLEYREFGKRLGYTGSVTSRANLISLMTRLEVQLNDITCFVINDETQPQQIIEKLFVEVRNQGNERQ